MIFFCWATLEKSVYVFGGGGGFTRFVSQFVEAGTLQEASAAYQAYLEKKGICVRHVRGNMAAKQDKATYVFPENILLAMPDPSRQTPSVRGAEAPGSACATGSRRVQVTSAAGAYNAPAASLTRPRAVVGPSAFLTPP